MYWFKNFYAVQLPVINNGHLLVFLPNGHVSYNLYYRKLNGLSLVNNHCKLFISYSTSSKIYRWDKLEIFYVYGFIKKIRYATSNNFMLINYHYCKKQFDTIIYNNKTYHCNKKI